MARLQFQSIHKQTPLPQGWRAEWSSHHKCFFFVDTNGTCTWNDPRERAVVTPRNALANANTPRIETLERKELLNETPDTTNVDFPTTRYPANNNRYPQNNNLLHKQRYCCGAFSTRRNCCIFVWIIVVVILVGFGVAAYFLWPRTPTIIIGAPYFPSGISPVQYVAGTSKNPAQFAINLAVDVKVYSPNNVDIFIDKIEFNGLILNSATNTPITSAPANGIATRINFPPKRETSFTLPFTVGHPINVGTSLSMLVGTDELMNTISTRCASASGTLDMTYSVKLTIQAISWTGFKPTSTGKFKVQCPTTAADIGKLFGLKV
ncbi:UNVERIFIED_CONTAM: hypothetical protein HDU68_000190 [Siphonaria sp. JEL0065]|nr:hypothetical protein HDU68_000190 [Siphonaria sp. JEL0065]